MKYELDVLAALTQLPEPTTQNIVAKTGISERKVHSVLKTLQTDLKMEIETVKSGRFIRYKITNWGVFETGSYLRKALANRPIIKSKKAIPTKMKVAFYESVKMRNYRESSRLEGISIRVISSSTEDLSKAKEKRSLIRKYSKYKASSKNG